MILSLLLRTPGPTRPDAFSLPRFSAVLFRFGSRSWGAGRHLILCDAALQHEGNDGKLTT